MELYVILEPCELINLSLELRRAYQTRMYYGPGGTYYSGNGEQILKETEEAIQRAEEKRKQLENPSNPLHFYHLLEEWMNCEFKEKTVKQRRCIQAGNLQVNPLLIEYLELMHGLHAQGLDLKLGLDVIKYIKDNCLLKGILQIQIHKLDELEQIVNGPPAIFSESARDWILQNAKDVIKFYHDARIWVHPELSNEAVEKTFESMGFEIKEKVEKGHQVRYTLRYVRQSGLKQDNQQ